MELHVFAEICKAVFELEHLFDGFRSVSVVVLFSPYIMVFMLGISVVCRMLWHSASLASKDGSANDFASLSPGLLGGTWGASLSPTASCLAHFILQER